MGSWVSGFVHNKVRGFLWRTKNLHVGALGFPTALQSFLVLISIYYGIEEHREVWQQAPKLYTCHCHYSSLVLLFVSPSSAWTNGCNRVYPLKPLGPLKSCTHSVPTYSPWVYLGCEPLLVKKWVINKSGNLGQSLDKCPFSGKEIPHNESEPLRVRTSRAENTQLKYLGSSLL